MKYFFIPILGIERDYNITNQFKNNNKMKKIYLLLAGVVMSTSLFAQLTVATFENAAGGVNVAHADTCWQGNDAPVAGVNVWTSGSYNFATYMDVSDWGTYFYAFTVSNETASTSTGWTEPYRSANGGAYEGENFAVFYQDWNGNNSVKFEAQVVPGFFINNNAYTVNSMCNVEGEKFDETNYLTLTMVGLLNNDSVNAVTFDLAKDGEYVNRWTYVDLSVLGTVDEVRFSFSGNKNNTYGLVTPTYFCMDNFGVAKPEGYVEPERAKFSVQQGVENTEAKVKAVKVIRNGQVVILRGEKAFNVLGAEL